MKKFSFLLFSLLIGMHYYTHAQCVDTTLQSPAIAPGNVEYTEFEGGDGYLVGPSLFGFTEFYQKYSLTDYAAILGITLKDTMWIDKVYVFYGKRLLGTNPGKIVSKVYSVMYNPWTNIAQVGSNYVGSPGYAPDTTGYLGISDSLSMAALPAVMSTFGEQPLIFPKPVEITQDSFFVSIALSNSPGDTLAIGNSIPGGSLSPPFPGSSWASYLDSPAIAFYSYQWVFEKEIPTYAGDDIDIGILPHIICNNPLGINNVSDDNIAVMPFPNPVSTELYLGYDISKSEALKITLTDMLGRVVIDLGYKNLDAGSHLEQIDVSGLSSGMYIYSVETTSGVTTGKIMVAH